MKPSFALSLSFDGIRLLHRAAGGWRVVGDVGLDASDMTAELGALRDRADLLAPGQLFTKILLPDEQIKYLTIPSPGPDEAAQRAAAQDALAGATPYAVDDLAFDISLEGDALHIAAVALETLAEAEDFATQHQFQPVGFAAIPGEAGFLGEPFFGPTEGAGALLVPGEAVEADGIAVVIIGDAEMPSAADPTQDEVAHDAAASEPEVKAATEKTATETTEAETIGADETQVPETSEPVAATNEVSSAPKDLPEKTDAPENPPAPDAQHLKTKVNDPPASASAAAPVAEGAAEGAEATNEPKLPVIGFASRRAAEQAAAPRLGGAHRGVTAPENTVIAAHIPVDPDAAPPPPLAAPVVPEPEAYVSPPPDNELAGATAAPEPRTPTADVNNEQERMTVFGARQAAQVGGKPRFLGLMLTAALLLFLAGVAAWASVFLDDGLRFSSLFGRAAPQAEKAPEPTLAPPSEIAPQNIEVAALDPQLSAEDNAVLDALGEPVAPDLPTVMKPAEIETKYATDGIYPRAPEVPPAPAALVDIENLYLTSVDPVSTTTDAVALPPFALFQTDEALPFIASPAAAGTRFVLDDRGLVIPTVQGALSPDGYMVFQGRPPLVPPTVRTRAEPAPTALPQLSALAAFRPTSRPDDLSETNERAQLDGLTRNELAGYRPALRPPSVQEQAEAAAIAAAAATAPAPTLDTDAAVTEALTTPDPVASATRLAVPSSIRPDTRPRNFARTVRRAQQAAPQQETRVASAAAVAPRTVTPKIPSRASVAKAATTNNALNLRKVNLIGVYGKPSNRRALVRLGNGRYRKVVVGDRVDGGVVSAIGESELRYTKRGRALTLKGHRRYKMPQVKGRALYHILRSWAGSGSFN